MFYHFIISFSAITEEKLFNFDYKIKELEVMVKLFESKLDSLPVEITSKFPNNGADLGQVNIDIVNTETKPTNE